MKLNLRNCAAREITASARPTVPPNLNFVHKARGFIQHNYCINLKWYLFQLFDSFGAVSDFGNAKITRRAHKRLFFDFQSTFWPVPKDFDSMYLVSSCAAHLILQACKFSEESKSIRASKVRKTVKNGRNLAKKSVFRRFDLSLLSLRFRKYVYSIQRSKIRHLGCIWSCWHTLQEIPVLA